MTATNWSGPVRVSPHTLPSIRPVKVADVEAAANLPDLLAAYAEECAIEGMPPPHAKLPMYRALEAVGAIQVVAGFADSQLAGFVIVISTELPHYGTVVSSTESFFVGKAWRKSGLGLALLKAAEAIALERGSPGLLVSAPAGGVLSRVLPGVGYAMSNQVFFKRLVHE